MSTVTPSTNPQTVAPQVSPRQSLGVGLIGLGTVGGGVYRLLQDQPQLQVRAIAVRSPQKARSVEVPADLLGTDPMAVVENPDVHIVVEVIGGIEPARSIIRRALELGKPVISANKELLAKHGSELFELAQQHNTALLLEGAVAGGIPILMPLKQSLAGNQVQQIVGILNGTTNYILTRMVKDGWSFQAALEQAQAKGFAEADPTSDVEGYDAAYKIALLARLGFGVSVPVERIHVEGISKLELVDIQAAEKLGYAVKLLGLAEATPVPGASDEVEALDIRVHPMLVDKQHPLASIQNEYNAVFVKGHAVGDCMFYGKGAGELPTASAVMGDVLAVAADLLAENIPTRSMAIEAADTAKLLPIGDTHSRYYLRLTTQDLPGVVGELGKVFGKHGVSIRSILQEASDVNATASLTIVTHHVRERDIQAALETIAQQETTHEINTLLRVL